jgi:ubiquinone/menaquinone biosynthesis C-methylase UbiE
MFIKPRHVREYRRLVRFLVRRHGNAEAMERAVGGGGYERVGAAQAELLRSHGLADDSYLIDVGCGSGRTAFALRSVAPLRYHGTDVVPELLDYAREKAARPDWRFTLVEGLTIPDDDNRADMVAMFSVLTHLTPAEGFRYVTDAIRVLKPGGRLVASFLDEAFEPHRRAAGTRLEQFINHLRGGTVTNVTLKREQIAQWARDLKLRVEIFDHQRIGQSYFVLTN